MGRFITSWRARLVLQSLKGPRLRISEFPMAILRQVLGLPAYRDISAYQKHVLFGNLVHGQDVLQNMWVSECNPTLEGRHWKLEGAFNLVGKQARKERIIMSHRSVPRQRLSPGVMEVYLEVGAVSDQYKSLKWCHSENWIPLTQALEGCTVTKRTSKIWLQFSWLKDGEMAGQSRKRGNFNSEESRVRERDPEREREHFLSKSGVFPFVKGRTEFSLKKVIKLRETENRDFKSPA